jgi:hypothetical protein
VAWKNESWRLERVVSSLYFEYVHLWIRAESAHIGFLDKGPSERLDGNHPEENRDPRV